MGDWRLKELTLELSLMVLKLSFLSAPREATCSQQDRGLIVEEVDHPLRFTSGHYMLAIMEPKHAQAAGRGAVTGSWALSQAGVSSLKPCGGYSTKNGESVTSN